MKLAISSRPAGKKSENKKIRRENKIPAILYSKGEKGKEIVINGIDFQKILDTTPTGTLSSKVFHLELDGQTIKAIVKDIQYHITSYNVIHIDFEQLDDELPVSLNIPVVCMNVVDCAGIKLGGVLRQVKRKLKVTCLPKDIPSQFEIDVKDLVLGQTVKLNQIAIPPGVRPTDQLNEVAVVIARK